MNVLDLLKKYVIACIKGFPFLVIYHLCLSQASLAEVRILSIINVFENINIR